MLGRIKALKLILLFALINSSIFIGFHLQGFSLIRISIVVLLLISVCLLFILSIKKEKQTFYIHTYFKFLLFFLFIWSLFTVFRSFSVNSKDLISLFGHYLMGWAWTTPLAIVFGLNIYNWMGIFNFLVKLLLVGMVLSIIFIPFTGDKYAFGIIEWLQFFPILLLTYVYQHKINKKIILLATISFIIVSIIISQRINAAYIIMTIFFTIVEFFRYKKTDKLKKLFVSVIIVLSVLGLSVTASDIYTKITEDKSVTTDTRTFLFVELFADMSDNELIIGRGALGTYYSPYFAYTQKHGLGGDSSTRMVNEVGYLQMILKGGFIMMFLYLLILLPAAYLGIFKSKNLIARMSGYIILIYLVIWIVSYYSVYSAEYILLWMAVGTAISPIARNTTDKELKIYINGGYNNWKKITKHL